MLKLLLWKRFSRYDVSDSLINYEGYKCKSIRIRPVKKVKTSLSQELFWRTCVLGHRENGIYKKILWWHLDVWFQCNSELAEYQYVLVEGNFGSYKFLLYLCYSDKFISCWPIAPSSSSWTDRIYKCQTLFIITKELILSNKNLRF